jgi:tetratricopeptide (TPR) repeat protein
MAMDKFGTEMNDADRAAVLDILGMLETDNELYEQARETLFAAVETIRKMFPDHALKYRPMLGKNLNRLGRTLLRLKENEEAKEYLLEALEINRELMKTDPYDFEPQVMEGLGDLGLFHAGEKDFDAIEKYFLEAIGIARKLAGEEKYFKTRLGFFLTAMAAVHEEMLDIEAAEREHNEAWEVYSELAEGEPEIYMVGLAKRSLMRADFYQQYKREERERSIWDAADAFVLAYNFTDDPTAVDIAFRAKEILENWELDAGEIGHRLNFQEAVRGNLLKKIKILMVNGEL